MDPRKQDAVYTKALAGDHAAIKVIEKAIMERKLSRRYIDERQRETYSMIALYFSALCRLYNHININGTDYDCDFLNETSFEFLQDVVLTLRLLSISGTKKSPAVPLTNCEPPLTLRDLAIQQLQILDLRIHRSKTKVNIIAFYNILIGARNGSMRDAATGLLPVLLNDPQPMLRLILEDNMLYKHEQKEELLSELITRCEHEQSRRLLRSLCAIISAETQHHFFTSEAAKKWLLTVTLNASSYWHQQLMSADHLTLLDKLEICDFLCENDDTILSVLAELARIKKESASEEANDNKSDLLPSTHTFLECAESRRKNVDELEHSLLSTVLKTIEALEKLTDQIAFLQGYDIYQISTTIRKLIQNNRQKPLLERYKTLVAYTNNELTLKSYPANTHVYPLHVRELLLAIKDFDTVKLGRLVDEFTVNANVSHDQPIKKIIAPPNKVKFD